MKSSDIITISVLALILILTFFVVHERNMENQSLRQVIRAEVKAEIERRYRNIPHIQIEKVYTLHATGDDIVLDVAEEGDN